MKKIKLPISNKFCSSLIDLRSPEFIEKFSRGEKIHFITPDFGKGSEELEIVRDNGSQVVYATTDIENKVDEIIELYFFGPKQMKQKSFFVNQVLQSSRFDFVFKKELLGNIVNEQELLESLQKDALQKNMKKIMDWRNAFAHGDFLCDHQHIVHLRYFSGGQKSLVIDDNYWEEVENCFKDTISLLEQVKQNLGKHFRKDS